MGQPMVYEERIKRIKKRKEERGWSNQALVDKTIDAGGVTSLSTVKRICAEGSEEKKFKSSTLEPIERALGLLDEEKPISPVTETFYHAAIRELNAQLKASRKAHTAKNLALIFLMVYELVKIIYDRLYIYGGWYTPENKHIWYMYATAFGAYCIVMLVYMAYWKKTAAEEAKKNEVQKL